MGLEGLELDRQAMAIPARHVLDAVALLHFDAQDDVLEDLIQRVADVEGAVGIGRTIMEEEGFGLGPVGELPLVESGGAALEVVVAELWCRSWSGGLFDFSCEGVWMDGWSKMPDTYGKDALGSRMVDCHDFDMIRYRPCPRACGQGRKL